MFAIIGAVFGVVGALTRAACADTCASVAGSSTGYTVRFIVLGIGGAVVSLVGGIRAYGCKSGRVALCLLGAGILLLRLKKRRRKRS